MGLTLKSEKTSGSIVIFQQATENAQGGFNLDLSDLVAGSVVPAGTVMGFDESTRIAKVLKTAKIHANATNIATDYQVEKGHLLKVGNYVGAVVNGKAYGITAIDTTNAAYDVITVGTTLGVALSAGDAIFQSSATGTTACAYAVVAKGLLFSEVLAEENTSVAVALRATVYERRIPVVTDAIKALLPNVIFSKSF